MKRYIAYFIVLGTLCSSVAGCIAAETAQGEVEDAEEATEENVAEQSSAITGSHKICSTLVDIRRDTLVVPNAWTSSTCNSFRASVGSTAFQLGCISDSGYSWGAVGGWTPPNNSCGW